MAKPTTHHTECEHLMAVARGDVPLQRDLLVSSIEKLFLSDESNLTEKEQAIMADILRHLIRDVEANLRKNLADKLAQAPHPPQELVNILADDSIDVCYNLLVSSPLVTDETLLHIIHHRGVQHQLAISLRRHLSVAVTDALVATENVDVITSLLQNESASISQATLAYLAHESKRVTRYQRPLLCRSDLSPDLARTMYSWVSVSLRQHITENFAIDPATLDAALKQAVPVEPKPNARSTGSAHAERLAESLEKSKQLTTTLLLKTLRSGEIPLFEALLARLLRVKPELIVALLYESDLDNIAIAARHLKMSESEFGALLSLLHLGLPQRYNSDTSHLKHYFQDLKVSVADAVVKTWRRDPKMLLSSAAPPTPESRRRPPL